MTIERQYDGLTEREPEPGTSGEELVAVVAGAAAMMAGAIHLVVAPGHADVSWQITVFFVVLGVAQLALGASFRWRLPPGVLLGAIYVHLGVMALYVASRTVDLAFIPPHDAGHSVEHLPVAGGVGNGIPVYPGSRIEPVGVLDVACLVAELVLVAMLVAMLPPRWRSVATSSMLTLGLLAVGLRAAGLLG